MKTTSKVIAVLLAAVMALSLAACGATDKPAIDFSLGLNENGTYKDVDIKETVKLGEYKNLPLPEEVTTVTDEALQREIDAIMAQFDTTEKVTDRKVEDKDTVNIDYVGSIDGVEFDGGSTGGKGTNVTIGVTQYIGDFLEQLIGHKPGETFDINVSFPDPYEVNPDLAGKPAVFNCTINYIAEPVHQELTEEFVKENLFDKYGFASITNMKEQITQTLISYQVGNYVWETVDKNAEITVPENLVENEFTLIVKQMKLAAINYGMEVGDMFSYQFGVPDEKTFRENYGDRIKSEVRNYLLMQAIAEDAGLLATEDDVKAYFEREGTQTTMEDAVKQYGAGYVYRIVTMDKVASFINEQNPAPQIPMTVIPAEDMPEEKPAEPATESVNPAPAK